MMDEGDRGWLPAKWKQLKSADLTRTDRRVVVALAIVLGMMMLLFPPWVIAVPNPGGPTYIFNAGYDFFWNAGQGYDLNYARLLFQWAILGLITFLAAKYVLVSKAPD